MMKMTFLVTELKWNKYVFNYVSSLFHSMHQKPHHSFLKECLGSSFKNQPSREAALLNGALSQWSAHLKISK